MTDDTDTDESKYDDAEDAFETLADYSGQSYITAEDAWYILCEFHEAVHSNFVFENHPYAGEGKEVETPDDITREDRAMALSMALKSNQETGTQARGIVSTWPHQMIVTAADVSEILVEAIGDAPSDASYAGAGFQADARHEEDIETLRTALDDYIAKTGEPPKA